MVSLVRTLMLHVKSFHKPDYEWRTRARTHNTCFELDVQFQLEWFGVIFYFLFLLATEKFFAQDILKKFYSASFDRLAKNNTSLSSSSFRYHDGESNSSNSDSLSDCDMLGY